MYVTHDEVKDMALGAGMSVRQLNGAFYAFVRRLIERVSADALAREVKRLQAEPPAMLVVKFDRQVSEAEIAKLRTALRDSHPGPLLLMPKEMDLSEIDDEILRRAGLMRIPPSGS